MRIGKIVIILCILLLVGCTPKGADEQQEQSEHNIAPKDRITIAGIYKDGSKGWFIHEGLSAEEEASRLGAKEFIYIDVKMDPELYEQALTSMIDEEVDGVIICIPDQNLSQMTVDILREEKIPVVATNDPIVAQSGRLLTPFVGVDDYALGDMTGDWMANYAIKNGLMIKEDVGVLILENNQQINMKERANGQYERFVEMIPGFDVNRIFRINYNGETENAFNVAMDMFTQEKEITTWLVMTGNDEGAIGVVRSLEQLGLDQNASIISIGGTLALDEFNREYSALKASSYYSPKKIGKKSAEILMEYILYSEPMPQRQLFNAEIITKDNYQEVTGVE
ncbi:substrate-binding domain-containing protein [Vallitaleaceae bacterium 9-2]